LVIYLSKELVEKGWAVMPRREEPYGISNCGKRSQTFASLSVEDERTFSKRPD
jgi:hypothetical protein